MTKIDITQQKLKERVLGLEGAKIESNKRLLEVKMEQDSLRSKLDESKILNLDVGIKIKEIKTDQQELQKQIGILHAKQYMAAESDITGKSAWWRVRKMCSSQTRAFTFDFLCSFMEQKVWININPNMKLTDLPEHILYFFKVYNIVIGIFKHQSLKIIVKQ